MYSIYVRVLHVITEYSAGKSLPKAAQLALPAVTETIRRHGDVDAEIYIGTTDSISLQPIPLEVLRSYAGREEIGK